jgi:Zn finger protein HypA/HybF involved in hydrogenase expression
MNLALVLNGVGSIGMFSSRAFVTAFAIAAALRWGPDIAFVNQLGLLQQVDGVPTWFTHDITLMILGVLGALEILATKSPEIRAALREVDSYLKSASAFVTHLAVAGVINHNDVRVINEIVLEGSEPLRAGFDLGSPLSIIGAAVTGMAVWYSASVRNRLMENIGDADPDDVTFLQSLLSWGEDLFAIIGTFLLILYPPIMIAVTAIVLSTIWLIEHRARRREEKSRVACASCGSLMYPSAVICHNCKQENPSVTDVSWTGRSKLDTLILDKESHAQKLLRKQRCPRCAHRLKPGLPTQNCSQCDHQVFGNSEQIESYLKVIDSRLPKVLVISALLSSIPVIGLIPGIIYYRQKLVTPLSRYTPFRRGLILRWAIRLFYLILIWVQLVPIVGVLVVPLMAVISYGSYRKIFLMGNKREVESELHSRESG